MTRKTIVLISDFEIGLDGNGQTGYSNIATLLGNQLHRQYNVMALGVSYRRNQHNNIFGITQVRPSHLGNAVLSLQKSLQISDFLYVLDIPFINKMMETVPDKQGSKIGGIFAVEGDPLGFSWTMGLSKLDYLFPISQFGEDQCKNVGLPARHLPIPLDLLLWKQRAVDDRKAIKESLGFGDKTVLFFNGDNQERKNLSALLEAMVLLPERFYLNLLIRKQSPVGWNVEDLIQQLELQNKVNVIDRGMPQKDLWKLYAGADFYIHPTLAEGLGLPILEAQAVGVPVIIPKVTAMTEHLINDQGIPLKHDFRHIGVFGNMGRYYIFPDTIANKVLEVAEPEYSLWDGMIDRARKYVESRTLENAMKILIEQIGE